MAGPVIPVADDDEIVAAEWIATIPGFSRAMTGPVLPPDVNGDGSPAAWLATGFVTVMTAGGTPDALLPVHRPVIEVKCWAAVPGSNRPPWQMAKALGSAITKATWDRITMSRPLDPVVNGVACPRAVVQGARMLQHFRRLYADDADYAVVQADLWLEWVTPSDVIP